MKEKLFKVCRSGIAMLLALCMVAGLIPGMAFAASDEIRVKTTAEAQAVLDGNYEGKTLILEEGEYGLLLFRNTAIAEHFDDMTIIGEGEVKCEGIYVDVKQYHAPQNLTVKNITFVDAGDNSGIYAYGISLDGLTVEECVFLGNARIGYHFNAAKNVTVRNCKFDCTGAVDGRTAIWFNGGTEGEIIIENNVIENTAFNAIQLGGTVAGEILIANNIIRNTGDRGLRFNDVQADAKLTVEDNFLYNAADEDGEMCKASSVADGAEVVLNGNTWGSDENTEFAGMIVGDEVVADTAPKFTETGLTEEEMAAQEEQAKAEALALIDAKLEALYEYVANNYTHMLQDGYDWVVENEDMIRAELDKLMAAVKAEAEAYAAGAPAEAKATIDALKDEAETLEAILADLYAQLEAKVAELDAQMAAAAGTAAADLEAAIAATKKTIADLEAAIAETEAALAAVDAAIKACIDTLDDLEEAIRYLDNAVVALDGEILDLIAVLNAGATTTAEDVIATVKAARAAVESAINLVKTTIATVEELVNTVATLGVKAHAAVVAAYENCLALVIAIYEDIAPYTEEYLKGKIAALEAEYGELEDIKMAILAAGYLAAMKVYEEQHDAAYARIMEIYNELMTCYEEKKPELLAELARLENEVLPEVKAEADKAYNEAVAAAEAQYEMTLAYIEEKAPIVAAQIDALVKNFDAAVEAALADVAAVKATIENAIETIKAELANAKAIAEVVVPVVMTEVKTAVNELVAAWNNAYNAATTSALELDSTSYYVALGDSSAAGTHTYVDELAAELGLASYKNLANAENDIVAQMAALADPAVQAEIAKAELITVGFSQIPMINTTIDTLYNEMVNGTAANHNWAQFIGEENVRYIDALCDELFEGLTVYKEEPMDAQTAAMVTAAVEAYAYGVTAYACVLPQMVNAINAINPDAVVVVVGMYNPLDGVSFDLMGNELAFGEYLDYLVTAAQVHGTAYSMITGNSIYVNAPAVETQNTKDVLALMDMMELITSDCAALNPSAAGHEYIQQCIYNALMLNYRPEGLYRLKGATRYETGLAVADEVKELMGVDKFDTVIVAYGEKFPDALTGSSLAAALDAPILLTDKKVDAQTAAYIKTNLAEGGTVVILGGEAAVSAEFAAMVGEFNVVRLYGKTRYETNLAILSSLDIAAGAEILVATGKNYADSLSASATGLPMLLVDSKLTAEQKAFLSGINAKFTILGGEAAVSEDVANELAAYGEVVRVKGPSRYETSVAIAERYFGAPSAAVLAYGEAFPDGLCGGPLAYLIGAPLLLTHNDKLAAADAYVADVIFGYVTGGTARLTDATVQEIFDATYEVIVK